MSQILEPATVFQKTAETLLNFMLKPALIRVSMQGKQLQLEPRVVLEQQAPLNPLLLMPVAGPPLELLEIESPLNSTLSCWFTFYNIK